MISYSNKTESVRGFIIDQDSLIIQFLNGDIFFNNNHIITTKDTSEITLFDRVVFINDWEGNYNIVDNSGKILDSGTGSAFYSVSSRFIGRQYIKQGILFESLIDKNQIAHFQFQI